MSLCPTEFALAIIGMTLAQHALRDYAEKPAGECTCPNTDEPEKSNNCPACIVGSLQVDAVGVEYALAPHLSAIADIFVPSIALGRLQKWLKMNPVKVDPDRLAKILLRILPGRRSPAARNRLVQPSAALRLLVPSAN